MPKEYKVSDFGKYLLVKEPQTATFLDSYQKAFRQLLEIQKQKGKIPDVDYDEMARAIHRQLASAELELKRRIPQAFSNFLCEILMTQIQDELKKEMKKVEQQG